MVREENARRGAGWPSREKLPKKVSKRVVRKGGNYAIMIGIIVWAGSSPEEAKEEMKMKKRFLALALCLVMAVSLLPITAAAYDGVVIDYVCITGSGFEKDADGAYVLQGDSVVLRGGDVDMSSWAGNKCTVGLYQDAGLTVPATDDPAGGGTCYLKYQIHFDNTWVNFDPLNNSNCVLVVDGYSTAFINCDFYAAGKKGWIDITFQVTKLHEHQWDLSFTENSLKATCTPNCPIGPVSVTITASSVTLPDSPFNATVEVSENFKEAFPGAEISDVLYQYNDSGSWSEVDPKTFTPKPGEYQAGVCVSGLPTGGDAAARALSTGDGANQGAGTVFLFVKYTAVDPAVTAQTGDSRPIELMMAGVAVFSVLAAAAFILDNKRRLHQ